MASGDAADLSRLTPTQLRHMAATQRELQRRFTRWAIEAERLAVQYEDLADVRDARRRREER